MPRIRTPKIHVACQNSENLRFMSRVRKQTFCLFDKLYFASKDPFCKDEIIKFY